MDDKNIEILEPESVVNDSSELALPMNFITEGTIDQESVRVYIKQDVYKRIEKFAREDTSKEVGSILLGEYVDKKDKRIVIISDYIEAKYTDASASTLTFTHETWDYVHKEREKSYPDKVIVGWQHTHPGYGIFLSNYDIFIQENFFNLPWQIAYVVDPIAGTRGFFEWKNNKVSKMTGFYIYDEVGTEMKLADKTKKSGRKSFPLAVVILSFLLFVSLILAVSFGIEKSNVMTRLNEANNTIAAQEASIKKMKEEQAAAEAAKEAATEAAAQPTEAPSQEPGPEAAQNTETFILYTVRDGDFLEKICQENGLGHEDMQKILRINAIKDANRIYAGQQLYLPMK